MMITQREWGTTLDGKQASLFTLQNANGLSVEISNYGATVVSCRVPDRNGVFDDIVLGWKSLEEYEKPLNPYFGSIIGRVCNRTGNGHLKILDKTYQLEMNSGSNHLHGGHKGFSKVVWQAQIKDNSLELSYLSRDGEENYPGNLTVQVCYTLTDSNALEIDYTATCDKPTAVNLTNHAYFNLKGEGNGTVLEHELLLNCNSFTPIDRNQLPTGVIASVEGTPMDFTSFHSIGERINQADEQLLNGKGYDHNFVINGAHGSLRLAARVRENQSGRVLECRTTEPGLQFYTGNFLNEKMVGKKGNAYRAQSGFCLETQHFPDSTKHSLFPTIVFLPGQSYKSKTQYIFSCE